MKDRLIDLLGKADEASSIQTGSFPSYEEEMKTFYTSIADYLLDNGVIVLPCKVGDTVYLVQKWFEKVHKFTVSEIRINEIGTVIEFAYDGENAQWKYWKIRYPIECFGRLFFLTESEAEAKLKLLQPLPILHGNTAPSSKEEAMKRFGLKDKMEDLKGE